MRRVVHFASRVAAVYRDDGSAFHFMLALPFRIEVWSGYDKPDQPVSFCESTMEIRAVLFDLDGVLVLTEQLKAEAHTETIRMLGGAQVPISFYDQIMGQSHEAVRSAFLHAGGIADANPQTYTSTFREIYHKLLETKLPVTPGIPDILQLLVKEHFRLAIVSSSSSKTLHWILEKTNLVQFFDALVSSDDVDGKKPSPDPYLRALKLLSAHPSSSVVFEDSEAGIKSAVSAGAKVIAVRHSLNTRHDLSLANAVIHSFMDRNAVLQQIQSLFVRMRAT